MSFYPFIRQLFGREQLNETIRVLVPREGHENNSHVSGGLSVGVNSHSVHGLFDGLIACGFLSLLIENKPLVNKTSGFKEAVFYTDVVSPIDENYKKAVKYIRTQATIEPRAQELDGVELTYDYQLKIVKAMIASARISGNIGAAGKQRIFKAIAKMEISSEHKGVVFELLNTPISIDEISRNTESIQHKSEIYLASCIVSNPQNSSERQHLDNLARALTLPEETIFEIEFNAIQAILNSA